MRKVIEALQFFRNVLEKHETRNVNRLSDVERRTSVYTTREDDEKGGVTVSLLEVETDILYIK